MRMYDVSKMFEIRLDHWRTMLEIITQEFLMAEELNRQSIQCSREKILVRYLYQKQSPRDQRGEGWGSKL